MPAPAWMIGLASLDHDGTDVDADIHVSGEAEIPDRAGVGATARGLQLLDDLHGPDFRSAGDGAGREAGPS